MVLDIVCTNCGQLLGALELRYNCPNCGGILDFAVNKGVIQKSGTWLSFEKEKLGQGKEAARNFLRENPKLVSTIEKRLTQEAGAASAGSKK